jgi:TonB family protein
VLKAASMPAILLECGNILSSKDRAFIVSDQGQQQIARSILQGILHYEETMAAAAAAGRSGVGGFAAIARDPDVVDTGAPAPHAAPTPAASAPAAPVVKAPTPNAPIVSGPAPAVPVVTAPIAVAAVSADVRPVAAVSGDVRPVAATSVKVHPVAAVSADVRPVAAASASGDVRPIAAGSGELVPVGRVAGVSQSDIVPVQATADDDPQYPGGQEAWIKYLIANAKYPKEALEKKIQGKVFVRFLVETDGTISDIQIAGTDPGYGLGAEAVRLVKESGKWTPAMKDGQTVVGYKQQPIIFNLGSK